MMAEYVDKQASIPVAVNSDGSLTGDEVYEGSGLNIQAGYLMNNNLEFALRYTQITPTSYVSYYDETMYTIGISKYYKGHKLKVQFDASYLDNEINPEELLFRLQFDLHF